MASLVTARPSPLLPLTSSSSDMVIEKRVGIVSPAWPILNPYHLLLTNILVQEPHFYTPHICLLLGRVQSFSWIQYGAKLWKN